MKSTSELSLGPQLLGVASIGRVEHVEDLALNTLLLERCNFLLSDRRWRLLHGVHVECFENYIVLVRFPLNGGYDVSPSVVLLLTLLASSTSGVEPVNTL